MWAKISNSATSMACAACVAAAATLPWTGTAAERLANENLRLSAFTDVDAFSAIPLYAALLGGDLTALSDLDGFSAIPPYLALLGGDLSAVNDLDSVNGLPALVDLLGGNIDTLFGDDTNSATTR